jgi:hypothetical protein
VAQRWNRNDEFLASSRGQQFLPGVWQKADRYEGTFTIDQYDVSGNLLVHIAGRITGTRITVDTAVGPVLEALMTLLA